MRTCPSCARRYPEVVGAPEQRCPYCGHEVATEHAPAPAPRGAAPLADPVGALAHAARFAARHYPRLLLLWLPVLLVQAGAAVALEAYPARAGLPDDPFAMTDADRLAYLGVALPLFFAYTLAALAGWALVGAFVLDASAGGARRGLVRGLLRRPLALLGLSALLAAVFLAGAALVVPFLVLFHMFLFAPAALAGGRRVGESLAASRRFARERATYGFTFILLLLGAFVVVASGAIAGLAAPRLFAGSPYAEPLMEALVGFFLWPLLPVLPASYWHLAERAGPGAGEGARVAAVARARATKCPRCAALVPYEATGAPVEVRCPSCGASGRVL